MIKLAERQRLGFIYEEEICNKYNLLKNSNYTAKWDAYYKNIPVSIKCEKFGSDIELADFFRQSSINEDFYLICGFHKDGAIVEEYILFIPFKEWHTYFNRGLDEKLKLLLKNITNSREDDEKWKRQIAILKKEWQELTSNLIRLRFKRDHKTQKRIQCAINNKDFYSWFLPKFEVNNFGGNN